MTTKAIALPGIETDLESEEELSKQAHLMVIAEGLANRIIDIPPYGITKQPLIKPKAPRCDYHITGDWWR